MAAGPLGLPVWATGVWADTVWEEGTWESTGAGTAPRTGNVVQICLTSDTFNGRVPVRYVTFGDEQSVPVETVGAVVSGVVSAVESSDANSVPVSEVVAG